MAKEWVEARKTICIDYNGVLDMYAGYKGSRYLYPMRPGADNFLAALVEAGWTVAVFTAADIENVEQFLNINKLMQYVSRITCEKVPALIYLDDRGIRFEGDFIETLSEIKHFKTFWETKQGADQ